MKLEDYLDNKLNEIFSDRDFDWNKDFVDLGVDSMDAFALTSNLQADFKELPLTIFLECANKDELLNYLKENYGNIVQIIEKEASHDSGV